MRSLLVMLVALLTVSCSPPTPEPSAASIATAAPTRPAPTATPRSATPTIAPSPTSAATATVPPSPMQAVPSPTQALPTATIAPLSPTSAPPTATPAPERVAARVVEVVDGDTLDVSIDGQTERLRLIGIDTPEVVDPRTPVQCFGREASAKAHELLDGQTVQLEADESQGERDRYGRLLRYIWLPDGRHYNLLMIAEGYAHEYTYDVPYRYQAEFKQAEREAREAARGLWASTTCNGDTERPADPQPTATRPAVQPTATTPPAPAKTVYYANCAAARAAGVAPLHRGEPGYRSALDRDNDGIACE